MKDNSAVSKEDYENYMNNPPTVPEDVIKYLERVFPSVIFTPYNSRDEVMFASGQQKMIEYLKGMNVRLKP